MALVLTWLLSLIQTKFARETGSPTGAEMLAAVGEAKAVGAKIKLIDRDIRVTLHRLNSLMPLSERVKLTFQMLFTMLLPKGKLDINKLTEDEVVRQLLQGFYKLSPTTYRVMIEERDDYMAKQLIPLLESRRRVVCVVGAGHVLGLERRLREALKEFERRIWWSSSLEFEYVW
jgi:pheromone shutdown protein TraB